MADLPDWSYFCIKNSESYLPKDVKKVLQIGVWTGDFTEWLLANRDIELIDDVDMWVEGGDGFPGYNEFSFNEVEKYYDSRFQGNNKVIKHKMTSDMFFATKPVEEIYDFVLIDGSHATMQTALDGINGYRFLKVGGTLAFDDYWWTLEEDTWLRPKTGINAVLSMLNGRVQFIHKGHQVWLKKIK
jgi:hypothetical protein